MVEKHRNFENGLLGNIYYENYKKIKKLKKLDTVLVFTILYFTVFFIATYITSWRKFLSDILYSGLEHLNSSNRITLKLDYIFCIALFSYLLLSESYCFILLINRHAHYKMPRCNTIVELFVLSFNFHSSVMVYILNHPSELHKVERISKIY